MARSFFVWKGVDCRSKGVRLSGPVPIVRPEERVKHIEIPGRAGDLTQLQGEDIYNSYIQTATIQVTSWARVREIYNWLKGSDYVTFSGEPDRRQPARIIGAITLNKFSRNLDIWTGEVQFYCQPLKELLRETVTEITSSGTDIRNQGDVTEKPLIKVTPSGTSVTVAAGGNSMTITNTVSGTAIWIDSDIMEILNADKSATLTKNATGNFPVLLPGVNTVTGSGWSKLEITRRERFL